MRSANWILLLAGLLAGPALAGDVSFTPEETARILRHGPWPPPWTPDPGNRVSGDPAAADLGRRLFFDARLPGPDGKPCAGCHDPARAFAEDRPTAQGIRPGR
ncbi:MAG: cytochrome c peroxidase, partial [Alphaproteobacteria bacterium]